MAVIKTQFTLRLDPGDYARIRKIAEYENRSATNMIETLIKQKIRSYEAEFGNIEIGEEELALK